MFMIYLILTIKYISFKATACGFSNTLSLVVMQESSERKNKIVKIIKTAVKRF